MTGIGIPFLRVVLPLMDSRVGPYIEVAWRTCYALTVVPCIVPLDRSFISFVSDGAASLRCRSRGLSA